MDVSSLAARVRLFWSGLDAAAGPIVVAVSGGPDSVALLHGLAEVRPGPLIVAHLNHQLRGQESDTDEAFVRDLAAALAVPGGDRVEFCCQRLDVKAQARARRDNLENRARRVRYDWFCEVARRHSARWLATGHTANDQAETVLHRLLRGTGLRGLRGIAARRELADGIEVVRPLLTVTRAEVIKFLKQRGQNYREDRSNLDRSLTRNRIRHELLPLLAEHYSPAIAALLGRLAGQAGEVFQDMESRVGRLLAEAELPRAAHVLVFDRRRLTATPRFLVRELFRLVWQREGWPAGGMTFDRWDRLPAAAWGEVVAVDLPGRIHVQCWQHVLQISRGEE